MDELGQERGRIVDLLQVLIGASGFQLEFTVEERVGAVPRWVVQFTGADTGLLLARHAELLHALEHLAAKALRLEPEEHELIRFDAEGYKEARDEGLHMAAEQAVAWVKQSGEVHRFPPMTSRERRMLHLALAGSGLLAESEGEGPRRYVVLRPAGAARA